MVEAPRIQKRDLERGFWSPNSLWNLCLQVGHASGGCCEAVLLPSLPWNGLSGQMDDVVADGAILKHNP